MLRINNEADKIEIPWFKNETSFDNYLNKRISPV